MSCRVKKRRKEKKRKEKRISHRLAISGSQQDIEHLHGVPRTAASIKLLDGLLALTLPFDFSPFFPPAVHVGSSSCNLVFECFTLGLAALIGMGGAEVEVEREREEEEGSG